MTTIMHIREVHIHPAHDGGQLDRLERKVNRILQAQGDIMLDLSELNAAVEADTAADAGIRTVLERIADELEASAGNPAAVAAVAAQIRANVDATTAAILAHTPAEVPPVEEPPVEEPPVEEPAPEG